MNSIDAARLLKRLLRKLRTAAVFAVKKYNLINNSCNKMEIIITEAEAN
jgi:hypothetical protein